MATHRLNRTARDQAVELSLDAAIEIDEAIRGQGDRSPALQRLAATLIGADQPDAGSFKRDLLGDARAMSLYRRAAERPDSQESPNVSDILALFAKVESVGLRNFEREDLAFIREFCLGLNRELVSEASRRVPEPFNMKGDHKKVVILHES